MKKSELRRLIGEEISRVQSNMLSAMIGNAKQVHGYMERISSLEEYASKSELQNLGKMSGQLVKLEQELRRIASQVTVRAAKSKG